MPYRMLGTTLRHVSVWRLVLLFAVSYVVIRLAIPFLIDQDVPFWIRALFLASGPVIGLFLSPLIIVHVRRKR